MNPPGPGRRGGGAGVDFRLVIRSVIMVELKPGVTQRQVDAFFDALAAVPFERRRAFTLGRDLDLVANTVDLVMVSDFDDEDAYRDWSVDPAHRKVSDELLKPIAERISRGQIRL